MNSTESNGKDGLRCLGFQQQPLFETPITAGRMVHRRRSGGTRPGRGARRRLRGHGRHQVGDLVTLQTATGPGCSE